MTDKDWQHVIRDAATLGVRMVQFIGGEPTLHPSLPELVGHALDVDLRSKSLPIWYTCRRVYGPYLACPVFASPPATTLTKQTSTRPSRCDEAATCEP